MNRITKGVLHPLSTIFLKKIEHFTRKKLFFALLILSHTTNYLTANEVANCKTFSLSTLQQCDQAVDSRITIHQLDNIVGLELPSQDSSFKFVICEDERQNYTALEIEQLTYLAAAHFEYTLLAEAKQLFETVLIHRPQNEYSEAKMLAHNYLGLMADMRNDWLSAYFHFQKILEWEHKNPGYLNFSAYLNLGALSTAANDFEKADYFFQKGLANPQKNKFTYGWLLHRIGELRQIKQEYDGAKKYFKAAVAYWQKIDNSRGICLSTLRLASTYVNNKEEKKALALVEQLIATNFSTACKLCKTKTYFTLSQLYAQKKELEKAKYYLAKSKEIAKEEHLIKLQKAIYEEEIQNNLATYGSKKNLVLFQNYKKLNQEINNHARSSTTKSMKYINDLVSKAHNYRIVEQEMKGKLRQQQLISIIVGGLLIMAILLTVTFFSFNQRNRRSKQRLEVLHQKTIKQKEALDKANQKIEVKNQELQLQLVKKAILMQEYGKLIQEVKRLTKEKDFYSQKSLIISKINQAKTGKIDPELNIQITNANQTLIQALSKKFPNLTQSEKRLCVLLKMNLTTKEIANITLKTPESVKVSRSRLRKKLGLTHKKIVIGTFLNQFKE